MSDHIKKYSRRDIGQTDELEAILESIREKRDRLSHDILREEEEKARIQKELSILSDRLSRINEGLARKQQARREYDSTIEETEAAYRKIQESSKTLLSVLKQEMSNLEKRS